MAHQVDLNLLNESERSEYSRLSSAVSRGSGVRRVVVLAWVAITLGLFAIAFANLRNDDAPFIDDVAGFLALGVGGVGAFWLRQMFQDAAHARKRRVRDVDTFLESIRYRQRLRGPDGGEGGIESTSRRQMQHEWYGDHSELNWRDRERAEMFGMDADTYVSNFLENDKD